jgi:hypothetical protein
MINIGSWVTGGPLLEEIYIPNWLYWAVPRTALPVGLFSCAVGSSLVIQGAAVFLIIYSIYVLSKRALS